MNVLGTPLLVISSPPELVVVVIILDATTTIRHGQDLGLTAPLPRRNASDKEVVDLLHTPSRDLADAEPDICHTDDAQAGIHKPRLRPQICRVIQIRQREDGDPDGDPEARHADGVDLVAVAAHGHLGRDGPAQRAPGEIEGDDLDDDKGDDDLADGGADLVAGDAETADDEDGEHHDGRGGEEEGPTGQTVGEKDGEQDDEDLDYEDDQRHQEGVGEADGFGEDGAEVVEPVSCQPNVL